MIGAITNLSLSVATTSEEQAERVVTAVCRKIEDFLHTKMIRVYKKDRSKTSVLLKPFAVISEGDPDVPIISIENTPQGVISWCVHNEKGVWLENLHNHNSSSPIQNKATDEQIDAEYLEFTFEPDSILVCPLKTEGELVGVIVIELDSSNILTKDIVDEFSRVFTSLGRLLYKSNMHNSQLKDTTRAVEQFLSSLHGFKFPDTLKTGHVRTGFIARPYGGEFDNVGNALMDYFKRGEVKASHYEPLPNSGLVVLGIMERIRNAHFFCCRPDDLEPERALRAWPDHVTTGP